MSPTDNMREQSQSCLVRQSSKYYEHRDTMATAMSVDYTGQFILLAGRRHLALQRLGQDECCPLRKSSRNSKYEVSATEWGVCQSSQENCAIATSQVVEIVTWGKSDPIVIHSLRGHTRLVTDIDWHCKDPNMLASCSIDTFTHLWDLRESRKPTLSLTAVCMSGATQVGFNRISGNLLAAAHDGDLRIWDIRKGSCPIHYITAHLARVHGINWSHIRETCLATASQDGTVKYFDVNNPRRAEKIITTSSPVWRARYTPIGNGLVSIVVPHLGRGENSLLLWSNSKQTDPVCSFVGHTDVILDFAWRNNRLNTTEIELVTWSRDQTLRLWKIDDSLLRFCEPTFPDTEDDSSTIEAIHIAQSPSRGESMARSLTDQPTCSLHHEFSLLNTNIPHIEVDVLDAIKRYAVFKISAGGHIIVIQINFPTEYPSPNIPPIFTFCQGTSIDESLSVYLMKNLKSSALPRVKKSRTCLEQCLRGVVAALKKSAGGSDKSQLRLQSSRLEGALSSALHDACIPFPRTSAVKFNIIGQLVSFAQNLNTKRISLRHQSQNVTPRALSAISGGLLGNVMGSQPVLYAHRDSNSSFYLQDRLTKSSKNKSLQKPASCLSVQIYETSKLLNLSKELAVGFILHSNDIISACKHNKSVAEFNGRLDLVPIWELAEVIATSNVPNNETNYDMIFYKDPFKKTILESLIMHFATNGDLQTAVMLCCVFHKSCPEVEFHLHGNKLLNLNPTGSPYHTVLPIDTHNASFNVHSLAMQLKQNRSNSWSDCLDWVDSKVLCNENVTCSLIRKSKMHLFDNFKMVYGEVLFGWQLLTQRSMILKNMSYPPRNISKGVEFVTSCPNCTKPLRTPSCIDCRTTVLKCTLCRLPVKKAANACLACGHGGHMEHLQLWFEKHDVCPSGCGCYCLKETSLLLDHID